MTNPNIQNMINDAINGAMPITDAGAEPARLYLKNRGLDTRLHSPNLLFHPALDYYQDSKSIGAFPVLIGIIQDAAGLVTGIQRIYITQDGQKANVQDVKKTLGVLKGASLALDEIGDVQNIAEGIETAMAIREATLCPTSAAINAKNLEVYEPPASVKEVHIWADKDRSETGQNAANKLAERLLKTGRKVFVHTPKNEVPDGSKSVDWLDVLNVSGRESICKEFKNGAESFPYEDDPQLVCIADVEKEEIDWLWSPYIPKRKLTLLEGDPGLGKSFITLMIASAISDGNVLGADTISQKTTKGKVVLFCTEDGLGDTIRPRLEAMNAELKNIFGYPIPIVLDDAGKKVIENALAKHRPELLVLDPLSAFFGGDLDINKANHARQFMSWLADRAHRFGCAIVVVRHITKSNSSQAIYRGLGSIDFTAAARSVLMVGRDPREESNRVIFHVKSNLAKGGAPIGYTMNDGKIEWTGVSTLTYETVFSATFSAEKDSTNSLEEAEAFLLRQLRFGRRKQKDIEEELSQEPFSKRTLLRAKQSLGIKSIKDSSKDGLWFWELPSDSKGGIERGIRDDD